MGSQLTYLPILLWVLNTKQICCNISASSIDKGLFVLVFCKYFNLQTKIFFNLLQAQFMICLACLWGSFIPINVKVAAVTGIGASLTNQYSECNQINKIELTNQSTNHTLQEDRHNI